MLYNDSTKCKGYCASCLMLHHCHGEYAVCPYGRYSEKNDYIADYNTESAIEDDYDSHSALQSL